MITFGFRVDPIVGFHELDEDTEQDPDFASSSRNNDWFGYGWLVPRNSNLGKGGFTKQTQFRSLIRKIWTAYKRHLVYVGWFALVRPSEKAGSTYGLPVFVLEADMFPLKIIEVWHNGKAPKWIEKLNKFGKGYLKLSFINLLNNQQTNCHTFCDGMFSSQTRMRWFAKDAQSDELGYWAQELKKATSYVDVMQLCVEYMYVA